MPTLSPNVAFILAGSAVLVVTILIVIIIIQQDRLKQLIESFQKLKKSFIDLDEQAKLIVRTDLELNKAQEELDRRLASLDALQKASRQISTTLDENEIFNRLDQNLITNLGFEKSLICLYGDHKKLQPRVIFGFVEDDIPFILSQLQANTTLINDLTEGKTISSINSTKQQKDLIVHLCEIEHFVISPILTQNKILGILLAGNRSNALPVTEGDEELVSILANQLGQSLENARYFEQIFRSSQTLEMKVHDRTKALTSALEEVKKISKVKSEFISAVSHELRTPLTSIKGYASLLMTGKLGIIPEPVKDRLSKINAHSDNLVKLINELLDISRIEAGRQEMTIEKCSPAKLIENVYDLLTPQMNAKNIGWTVQIPKDIPGIMVDQSQIERALINIIGNAIKFTPVNGTISVRAARESDSVKFEIADTGIGISEDDCEQIFNEFYRVENKINLEVKGTGLGLTLTKKIIEAHRGKIWVTSKINQGTTFHLILPTMYLAESQS